MCLSLCRALTSVYIFELLHTDDKKMSPAHTHDHPSPALQLSKEQVTSDQTLPQPLDSSYIELQAVAAHPSDDGPRPSKESAFKGLGWVDRLLAVWIFLAMAIGIILGNFVPNTGPALQKGKFVGVSIPIGKDETKPFNQLSTANIFISD